MVNVARFFLAALVALFIALGAMGCATTAGSRGDCALQAAKQCSPSCALCLGSAYSSCRKAQPTTTTTQEVKP